MVSLEDYLVIQNGGTGQGLYEQTKAIEKSKLTYLFQCYSRAVAEKTEVQIHCTVLYSSIVN